jgi:hypothetical protein
MVTVRHAWRFKTQSIMTVIALTGLVCGLLVLSWRNVWGPWPRWVRSVHSSGDYQATANASVAPVEGRLPGVPPKSAVRELIKALDDPKDGTRVAAIVALGEAGPAAAAAVPKLLTLLRDQPLVQQYAADALGRIVGPSDPERDAVVKALVATAEGALPRTRACSMVRMYAIQSISRLVGPEGRARTDLNRLISRALDDDYPLLRAMAGVELIRAGRGEEARVVLAAIRIGEEGFDMAQGGLGLLGSRTPEALRNLRMMTRVDSDPWLKSAAHDALGDRP